MSVTNSSFKPTTATQLKPLRVLLVSHTYVVGINQGKLNAVARNEQVEVALLAPSNWKALEWNRSMPLEQPYSNIKIYSAPVAFPGRVGACFYTPWRIWQVVNHFQPDIVQIEEEVFSLCAFEWAVWSRMTGKPIVVFGWENLDRQLPLPRYWLCQFVLKTARLILAGNQDGSALMRRWNYRGLLEVIPQLGVDPQIFSPTFRLSQQTFTVGFLGRIVPEKGIDLLLQALAKLQQQHLNCQLVICGSGTAESQLRQEAKRLGISDRVIWKGAVRHEQVPQEMRQFDVLVLPSRSTATWKEQFGHVLIEAMAMGIPVIGSTCGEIPNVIDHPDLVFQENNADHLAALLAQLISDPTWRETAKKHVLTRVHQHYTDECIAERLTYFWQLLCSQSRISPCEL